MPSTDTERYVRITLLTFEGGLWISRKVLLGEVNRSAGQQTLYGLLLNKKPILTQKRNRREITNNQYDILFPASGHTDIDEWDLSLVIKLINFLFRPALPVQDVDNLNEILRIRNEVVCHARQPSLQEQDFDAHWEHLETCIGELASNIDTDTEDEADTLVQKLRAGPLDLQSSITKVSQLCRNDELMDHVLTSLTQLDRTIQDVLVGVRELKRIIEVGGEDESRVKIPVLNSMVCLSGENDKVQLARTILLKVLRSAVNNVQNPDDDESVKNAVDQFLEESAKRGFTPTSAESGSILLKIQCNNLQGLDNMLSLFKVGVDRYCLVEIGRTLSTLCQTEVNVELLLPETSIAMLKEWLAVSTATMAGTVVPEVSLSTGSESVFDIECAPCSADGHYKEAERYCRECCEHFCSDCVRNHSKIRSVRHHQLIDKDAVNTAEDIPRVLDACNETCPNHKNEIIKLFCPSHNVTACVICVALDHKSCEYLEYIENIAEWLENRSDYKKFTTRLGNLTQQSEGTVARALKNKKRSSDSLSNVIKDMDAYREELVVTVDSHVKAIKDQAQQIHAQDTDKMDKLASQGNKALKELRDVATNVSNLKFKNYLCKLFVEMKQREHTFSELQDNLEDMSDDKVTIFTYLPDEDVRTMLRKEGCLGKIELSKNVKKASHVADINAKNTNNTRTCYISGMTIVSEDEVAVVDCNNKTIKLIDMVRNDILSEYKPEEGPWDVTKCKHTIAVTLPTANKIVFLKHAGGLVCDREISVNGDCRGIDCYDGKFYVVFDDEKKLEVMTPAGVVLQTFITSSDGKQLFQEPWYVTVSAASERIYVSEFTTGRLVVLDMAGNQTGTYEDSKLGHPRQLAVDGAGAMILCDYRNSTIHLLSPAGEMVKILLTKQDDVQLPYSVCFCKNTGKMYVGMWDCDTVKVYQTS